MKDCMGASSSGTQWAAVWNVDLPHMETQILCQGRKGEIGTLTAEEAKALKL